MVISLGSDAALRSRGNWCFFEDVGVEGFLAFQDSVDQVEELGHDGSDDDYGGLAFVLEAFGEGFADGVEAHGRHGGENSALRVWRLPVLLIGVRVLPLVPLWKMRGMTPE